MRKFAKNSTSCIGNGQSRARTNHPFGTCEHNVSASTFKPTLETQRIPEASRRFHRASKNVSRHGISYWQGKLIAFLTVYSITQATERCPTLSPFLLDIQGGDDETTLGGPFGTHCRSYLGRICRIAFWLFENVCLCAIRYRTNAEVHLGISLSGQAFCVLTSIRSEECMYLHPKLNEDFTATSTIPK